MIQAERPTTPTQVQYSTRGSSTCNKQYPSDPLLSSAASSSSSGLSSSRDRSDSSMKIKRDIILLARQAGGRFSPYRRRSTAEALGQRFTAKSLRAGTGTDITPTEAKKGKSLLANGVNRLSDQELQEGVLMKHAAREARRYRAMASAWELKEAEHYTNLMGLVHDRDRKEFEESSAEGLDDAQDFMAYTHEVYGEEFGSFDTVNTQLDQLEDEVRSRLEMTPTMRPLHNLPSNDSLMHTDDEHTG
ncbi:hypothetical protein OG21DRAFT_1508938 [Imleria badia]|nr:hypothetical protein OG21DRAFT_1508938 [Imleria badia]